MKRVYERPLMKVERFIPNEYVAGCATVPTAYKFQCTAGDYTGATHYAIKDAAGNYYTGGYNDAYIFTGNYGAGYENIGGRTQTYFYACGSEHIAEKDGEFITGYHLDNPATPNDENINVVMWIEDPNGAAHVHCTENLIIDNWETTKS